jgi:type I restriction enzyme S subunit
MSTRNAIDPSTTSEHARYDAYTNADVDWLDEIPAHWKIVRLKFLACFTGGGTPSKDNLDFWNGSIPWVSPKDMKAGRVTDTEDHITPEAVEESSTRLVEPGSVLVVVRSGILKHTIPVATNEVRVTLNQDLKAITPTGPIDSRYLTYLIEGRNDTLLLKWTKSGTTVESLDQERIANTETPVPPLPEQHAIAAYLDRETERIDALIDKKERLIDLLEEKRTALISHAVTKGLDDDVAMQDSGVEWLGKIPAGWDTGKVAHLLESLNRKRIPVSSTERAKMQGEYPYYGASGIIDHVDDYLFDEPLILVAEDGANLLSRSTPLAFVARGKYWVNNHAHILRPRYEPLEYWAYVLRSIVYDPWITGAAQPKLTQDNLGSVSLPVPPEKERREIAEMLNREKEQINNLIDQVEDGIDRLKEYRTALISAAVTGQIDVRGEAEGLDNLQ